MPAEHPEFRELLFPEELPQVLAQAVLAELLLQDLRARG